MPKPRRLDVERRPTSCPLAVADSSRGHAQQATAASVVSGRDETASKSSDAPHADGGVPTQVPDVKRVIELYAERTTGGGALGEWARCWVRQTTAGSGREATASGAAGPSSIGNVIGGGAAVPAAANTQGVS